MFCEDVCAGPGVLSVRGGAAGAAALGGYCQVWEEGSKKGMIKDKISGE